VKIIDNIEDNFIDGDQITDGYQSIDDKQTIGQNHTHEQIIEIDGTHKQQRQQIELSDSIPMDHETIPLLCEDDLIMMLMI
jgi:hypothetical protein